MDVKVEENDIRKKLYLEHIQYLKNEIEKSFQIGKFLSLWALYVWHQVWKLRKASELRENISELNCSIVENELNEKIDNLKPITDMKNCIKETCQLFIFHESHGT